jgi:4,5-DOPA dioxygenase extradiol
MGRMPAVFIGHGSPMNAIEHNRFTASWAEFGESIAKPRAVLAISAHWYVGFTAVTAMEQPKTIHDFFGFPQQLFDIEYPAPGDPELAHEVAQVLDPIWVGEDHDSWGIDHGTWSVLVHVFPDADVPVVQLAIDMNKSLSEHIAIGARLNSLRDQGVLIMASGNVVHNLRAMDWSQPDSAFDWNDRFDREVRRIMTNDPKSLVDVVGHQDYRLAVPTPDHFVPLAYVAGVAAESNVQADVLVGGPQYGSLSMTSYVVR